MKPIALRLLKEQTEVAENNPVTVAPSSWVAWGKAEPLRFIGDSSSYFSKGEIVGYWNVSQNDDDILRSDGLPVEFFNHEIMDCDLCEEKEKEAARSFVESFGVPVMSFTRYGDLSKENYELYQEYKETRYDLVRPAIFDFYRYILAGAIELPPGADYIEKIRRRALTFYEEDETTLYRQITDDDGIRLFDSKYVYAFKKALKDFAVCFYEISVPIVDMQLAFGSILSAIDGTIEKPNTKGFYRGLDVYFPDYSLTLINHWARTHRRLSGAGYVSDDNPTALVSATALQFIEAMDDATPWRRCRKCGRLFKYQINERRRNVAKKVNGGKGHEDAAYCCKKCADAGRQSAYRAGVRAKSGV